MVVAVAHRDVERNAAEQLSQVLLHETARAVALNQFGQFDIAAALALVFGQQRHGGGIETALAAAAVVLWVANVAVVGVVAPAACDAVKTLHTEGVKVFAEAQHPRRRHLHPGFCGERVRQKFPQPDIAVVVLGRKLGDPQTAIRVSEIGLGARTAKRSAGRDQHGEPAAQGIKIVDTFGSQLTRHRLKLTQTCHRRGGQRIIRDKWFSAGQTKAQRALARHILHAAKVIPRSDHTRRAALVFGLERLTALHQRLTPAVRRRIVEHAEIALRCL